ncbi:MULTISPECIES: UDP-N-acetylmuramate dehydrogenase [Pseudomonas]|uniref:UDP-N-acetylenolpyruvoylglucosamine reductase n=2 Tax=Pseudomonas TaxID=286 RepID=A0A2R7UNI0_PSEDL|nr:MULTISPECIES: UDP-N-acetylmuramate dehydrogenase [Pseudomonas]MRF41803.1 UDP-N-acetylmuramate dehydrogenase [Escherichia coli]MBF8646094.1 UDP-N-acetylmuramate dehydrogenase [Pseudomonas pudica]MBF8761496.1 UDP-N-acetylmuramate dehydrogenase [Pseudomonas pudica]MDZ5112339.1 UDP-N-acetylmuramate dehydrogenase [Pseudomonas putida]PTU53641.1 UDP-N-acetylenolpyruvoylglucosamine reductase [Pseudomonas plecoglossicida]
MTAQWQKQVSLKPYNTFGIDVKARYFSQAHDDQEVRQALAQAQQGGLPVLVIGGGSNLLLTRDIDALVLHMASRGRRVLSDDGERIVVEAEAGEPWHPFVQWTLAQGYCGLENLSLIPGTVGAAPMQNVGAYGVEIKDVFVGLTALDRETGELRDFGLAECAFGYRDSLFKRNPGHWLILRVRFALSRTLRAHLDYGPVRQRLAEQGVTEPTAQAISEAICSIRREKLPDPAELGNAGSFFKNPVVSAEQVERIRAQYPGVVAYPQADGQVKLAAGWLIEQAGWKGHREGDAGVHRLQSLVLVNYGQASGAQMHALARRIQADILERFGVELEMEPNLY